MHIRHIVRCIRWITRWVLSWFRKNLCQHMSLVFAGIGTSSIFKLRLKASRASHGSVDFERWTVLCTILQGILTLFFYLVTTNYSVLSYNAFTSSFFASFLSLLLSHSFSCLFLFKRWLQTHSLRVFGSFGVTCRVCNMFLLVFDLTKNGGWKLVL